MYSIWKSPDVLFDSFLRLLHDIFTEIINNIADTHYEDSHTACEQLSSFEKKSVDGNTGAGK